MDPWSRGREVARGVQRSSPKPEKKAYFLPSRGIENFAACFLHSSAQMCLYQTPGRRPPPITGRFVNTDQGGSEPLTGAPRSDFMAQSLVLSIDVSRTRYLAASNKHLAKFFSGRSWSKIGPGIIFFGIFEKFETLFFEYLRSQRAVQKSFGGYL